MKIEVISNISEINEKQWNNINADDYPFTSHEFLYSLEESKSVSIETGWQPKHIIVKNCKENIIGALPNYLKNHSYGEYVFDHSWADAYERSGGTYYPKLISAIPFTPVNGPRFLYELDKKKQVVNSICEVIENLVKKNNLSTSHINFLSDDCNKILKERGWLERKGIQFHWENKNYKDFNNFLDELKSQKRKMIKKERRSFKESNISIIRLVGDEINCSIWDSFYTFYLNTVNKKWGGVYLNRTFFDLISKKISSKILLILAKKDDKVIAAALNFISKDRLFGRNWGSIVNVPFLHFELCYYQAIEFAIENKIKLVEAGAQGPHKIKRGYLAKPTLSYHFIPNLSFKIAVEKFVNYETSEISKQIDYINIEQNPFNNKY